jgi:hypothetical protein
MADDNNHLFPSRSELACKSLFAATEEERQLARWLLSNTVERKDDEHPWQVLDRLYPPGSEAERLAELTPTGISVMEFVNAQPVEIFPNEELVDELMQGIEEEIDNLPPEPPSAPAPAKEIEDLAERTSLAARLRRGLEGPPITKPLVKVQPSHVKQPGTAWERFDSADPIY